MPVKRDDGRDVDDGKDARGGVEVSDAVCIVRHKVDMSVRTQHPPVVLGVVCDDGGYVDDGKGAS